MKRYYIQKYYILEILYTKIKRLWWLANPFKTINIHTLAVCVSSMPRDVNILRDFQFTNTHSMGPHINIYYYKYI